METIEKGQIGIKRSHNLKSNTVQRPIPSAMLLRPKHVQPKDELCCHPLQLSASVAIAACQDALRLASCDYDAATATLRGCHLGLLPSRTAWIGADSVWGIVYRFFESWSHTKMSLVVRMSSVFGSYNNLPWCCRQHARILSVRCSILECGCRPPPGPFYSPGAPGQLLSGKDDPAPGIVDDMITTMPPH